MKKYFIINLLLILSITTKSQCIDTIIHTTIYDSYYCYKTNTPLFVTYKLYKSGGNCSRIGLSFKSDKKFNVSKSDYAYSGYDIGHLANAEDFSYSKETLKETFQFINALPQLANLNRGSWKKIESVLREKSQKDSLYIITGGFDFYQKLNDITIPRYCFKIVKNLNSNQIEYYVFRNYADCEYTKLDSEIFFNLITNINEKEIIIKLLKL